VSKSVLLAVSLLALTTAAFAAPRVVITADPELDDSNSLVRYLLYSATFRPKG